jgi:hypothetical protein
LHVEIFPSNTSPPRVRNWHVRLVAGNGQKLATSEGYTTKWSAKRAARRMFPGLEIEEADK